MRKEAYIEMIAVNNCIGFCKVLFFAFWKIYRTSRVYCRPEKRDQPACFSWQKLTVSWLRFPSPIATLTTLVIPDA